MTYSNHAAIDIKKAAMFLGVCTATVRNWVKCGHLQTIGGNSPYVFHKRDIENLKTEISRGEWKKLNTRANKAKAKRTFIPDEYAEDKAGLGKLNAIIDFVKTNNVEPLSALLLVCLNVLQREKIISSVSLDDIIHKRNLPVANRQIKEEINQWISETDSHLIKGNYSFLLNCDIPKQRDILGFLYQSFLIEGHKSQNGSYYTPRVIVDKLVADYVQRDAKVFDPCCGTGQFLLAFAEIVENPSNIYGVDLDKIAVRIARLNILIEFKNEEFVPNIVCRNALDLHDDIFRDFDFIATNPPWGAHFTKTEAQRLKKLHPAIISRESFAYFLNNSIDRLRDGATLSYLLPEAILYVKTHRDIREIILKQTKIKKIIPLGRIFKNVFTPVIRLDLHKNNCPGNSKVKIVKENESCHIRQSRWLKNRDYIFDIHTGSSDAKIIDKIYETKITTLKNRAQWALGIVTGNNRQLILDKPRRDFEPIYKGKDVQNFILSEPSGFVRFTPEKFQQTAPVEMYRAKEKLIYRFISRKLVFAYDDKQRLTLNSANIVIPRIPDYPLKVIAALFNSTIYQFIFQKKYSSIKVLRSHLEEMPLPLWNKRTLGAIVKMVDKIMENREGFDKLDNYIMKKFNLSAKQINYLKKFAK